MSREQAAGTAPVLRVEGLSVRYRTARGPVDAVQDVSFEVGAGETVAIVGESGSGKSTTAHAIVRLLPAASEIPNGRVRLGDDDLVTATGAELAAIRGRRIGLVPQDPTVSLNPVMRIGAQVAEVLVVHGLADRHAAADRAIEALALAGLSDPEARAQQYPHELSGGMRQRVLIAIAMIAAPQLIVADEPTSALDVTVQRQILDQLDALRERTGTSILLITHDLGVAADRADRIVVMNRGRIVETGTPAQVLTDPRDPYTQRLIAAAPSLSIRRDAASDSPVLPADAPRLRLSGRPGDPFASGQEQPSEPKTPHVLEVVDLVKEFALPRGSGAGSQRAVDGVSFTIPRAQTLALVGESGSGKTTTARLALRLTDPTAGSIRLDGEDITTARGSQLRELRRRLQLVHQNPYATLNPRQTIEQIVTDPLRAFGLGDRRQRSARAAELLDVVALPLSALRRKPAELSGGQRQRVAIARALAISPELIVLDEPVSALDVLIQDQILTLLTGLQRELGVTYLFISHDLAVVRQIAHRVAVMRRGRIVESGAADEVFDRPRHEYTQALIDAIPGRAAAELPLTSLHP
ncbi:dipeptide ABC transporter ATP-binding protein [Microbacterium oxydans]|uniref:Glutathione import ATP-binding protein GsiA n=1 Tax=Microbacterium oxydans TaxID=82380 RepID=A0A0F0LAY4_9MICO|nr:ABC transporter ATP-binding protein [Microbacterium oxydans]KJL29829.1 Glutathione import ATP-binding protein GsiA [Microbacterium oxydans]